MFSFLSPARGSDVELGFDVVSFKFWSSLFDKLLIANYFFYCYNNPPTLFFVHVHFISNEICMQHKCGSIEGSFRGRGCKEYLKLSYCFMFQVCHGNAVTLFINLNFWFQNFVCRMLIFWNSLSPLPHLNSLNQTYISKFERGNATLNRLFSFVSPARGSDVELGFDDASLKFWS